MRVFFSPLEHPALRFAFSTAQIQLLKAAFPGISSALLLPLSHTHKERVQGKSWESLEQPRQECYSGSAPCCCCTLLIEFLDIPHLESPKAEWEVAKIGRKETARNWANEWKLLPADRKEDFLHILLNQFLQLWAAQFVSGGASPVLHSQSRPDHKLPHIRNISLLPEQELQSLLYFGNKDNRKLKEAELFQKSEGALGTIFQVPWLSPEGKCEILAELVGVSPVTLGGIKAAPEIAFPRVNNRFI